MQKPKNLFVESLWLDGAISMLNLIRDEYRIAERANEKVSRDNQVYVDSEINYILSSRDNVLQFLEQGRRGFEYSDHQRDKNGKLVSVKVRFR